jgi:hypothetical protein
MLSRILTWMFSPDGATVASGNLVSAAYAYHRLERLDPDVNLAHGESMLQLQDGTFVPVGDLAPTRGLTLARMDLGKSQMVCTIACMARSVVSCIWRRSRGLRWRQAESRLLAARCCSSITARLFPSQTWLPRRD